MCLLFISFNLIIIFCQSTAESEKVEYNKTSVIIDIPRNSTQNHKTNAHTTSVRLDLPVHSVENRTTDYNNTSLQNDRPTNRIVQQGRFIFDLPAFLFLVFSKIFVVTGNDKIVDTKYGRVRALPKLSRSLKDYWAFTGIPYARPPLGDLRYEPPQPHPRWDHIREANIAPNACMHPLVPGVILGKEDCLTLNVYTPKNANQGLPVMVFIHGGFFMTGSSAFFPPLYFMDEEVVLVTMNYRLNSFGFLNTGDGTVTGNMGLKDQSLALKWVKENIQGFNGDPEKITIFGESAGAASVHLQVLSPMSRGLFSKAIAQSGTALSPWAINRNPKQQAQMLASALGCPTDDTKKMVACLRQKPAEEFATFHQPFLEDYPRGQNVLFTPSIEVDSPNPFLSRNPLEILKSGDFSKVPFITGVTSGEGLLYLAPATSKEHVLQHINKHWNDLLKFIFNLGEFTSNPNQLIDTMTKHYSFGMAISRDVIHQAAPFFSDVGFYLDNHDVALFHSKVAPTYAYYYRYNGIFSGGNLFLAKTDVPFLGDINYLLGGSIANLQENLLNHRAENPHGVCHGDELALMFDLPIVRKPIVLLDADYIFSKRFVALWVSFAATGEPQLSKANEDRFKWEPVGKTNPNLEDVALTRLEMNNRFSMVKEPFFDRIKYWKDQGVTYYKS